MLHLLLTAGLALAPHASPTAQDRIEALEAAVASGRAVPTLRALDASGEVEDPRVVKACFQALVVENPRVRLAAVEALRFNPHPGALQVLHSQLRQGAAKGDPAVEAAVVRAIGQHASDASLSLLAEGALDPERPILGRARLLALGRVGTRDAIDALVLLGSTLPAEQRLLFADDLRLALVRATGVDRGLDVATWRAWWQGARKRFEPASGDGDVPTLCTLEWNAYWTSRDDLATPAPAPVALKRPEPGGARAVEASATPKGAAAGKPKGDAAGKPNGKGTKEPKGDAAGKPNAKSTAKPKGDAAAAPNAKAGAKQRGAGAPKAGAGPKANGARR